MGLLLLLSLFVRHVLRYEENYCKNKGKHSLSTRGCHLVAEKVKKLLKIHLYKMKCDRVC